VVRLAGVFAGGCDGEGSVGEHGQGDPLEPGGPLPDLVFIQAGDAFASLEVLLPLARSHMYTAVELALASRLSSELNATALTFALIVDCGNA
jgi:hypothetical protein